MENHIPLAAFLTREMLKWGNKTEISLRISSQSSSTEELVIHGITREGKISFRHNPTNNSILKVDDFRIVDLPIYVSVTDPGAGLSQGETFARLSLVVGGNVIFEYASGWVYRQKSLSWPGPIAADMRPGGGFITTETTDDPAANTEVRIEVPAGEIWKLIGIRGGLTTDANAATRHVEIDIDDGSQDNFNLRAGQTQIESLTRTYSFYDAGHIDTTIPGDHIMGHLPSNIVLRAGGAISTDTENLQAGDNWTSMFIYIERYFQPA